MWKDQDGGVEEDWRVAKDPMDPAFYSSCVFAKPPGGFINLPVQPYTLPPWQMGEQCVSCGLQRNLSSIATSTQPNWAAGMSAPGVCPDCDVRNTQASVDAAAMAGANLKAAGAPYVPRPEPPVAESSTGGAAAAGGAGGDADAGAGAGAGGQTSSASV